MPTRSSRPPFPFNKHVYVKDIFSDFAINTSYGPESTRKPFSFENIAAEFESSHGTDSGIGEYTLYMPGSVSINSPL